MFQLSLYLIMYLSDHLYECLFDIGAVKRTRFYKGHTVVSCKLLCFFEIDLSPILEVALVAYEEQDDILICVVHQFSMPLLSNLLE